MQEIKDSVMSAPGRDETGRYNPAEIEPKWQGAVGCGPGAVRGRAA